MVYERDTRVDDYTGSLRDTGKDIAWAEAARHDPLAFERLYNHYIHRLYAYILHRVGNQQDSEDLVAETFLRVVQGIKSGRFQGRQEGSFAAWLFRIAHNMVSDYYRGHRNRAEPLSLDDVPGLQAQMPLPEEALLRKEQSTYLRYLVSTLSPRRQEIITLKFFGGLRNIEIAAVLDLDERTVASHLCLGMEDLHRKYTAEAISNGEPRGER